MHRNRKTGRGRTRKARRPNRGKLAFRTLGIETLEQRSLLDGTPLLLGSETLVSALVVSGNQQDSDVAMDAAGNYVAVWDDNNVEAIYARIFDSAGQPLGATIQVNRNDVEVSDVAAPAVAMDEDGDFVVVWNATGSYYYGSGSGSFVPFSKLRAQRFNKDGVKQGAEFLVDSGDDQSNPDVAMDVSGDFVVAWEQAYDSTYSDVYFRRFDASGVPQGASIAVNENVGTQLARTPAVAMDEDGDFVVAFDRDVGGYQPGIFARQFNASGVPLTPSEFQVDDGASNVDTVRSPAAGMDATGNFVVAWAEEEPPLGSGEFDIHARRYSAAGVPLDVPGMPGVSEFLVNTNTANDQITPAVGMNGAGQFMFVWSDDTGAGSTYDVHAQFYHADGSPDGIEFGIPTTTNGAQLRPSAAINDNNNFIVTWDGNGEQPGQVDTQGVFAQRLEVLLETSVEVVAGVLTVTDIGTVSNDTLLIRRDPGDSNFLLVSDPNQTLQSLAGTTRVDANTVRVPIAGLTGMVVNTLDGQDKLELQSSLIETLISQNIGLTYNGGNPTTGPGDSLSLTGGTWDSVTYNHTNASSGTVQITKASIGAGTAQIAFNGIEPLTNTGTAANVVFNLTAGIDNAVLEDDGVLGNGLMRLRSTNGSFEVTTFAVPSESLTINAGGGNDTIAVDGVDSLYGAFLTINGDANTDTISFNGDITFAANRSLSATAETINVNAGSDLITSGTGIVTFTANTMAISATATIVSASTVTLQPQSTNREINLGSENGTQLSLTDAELDRITAGLVQIGSTITGTVFVTAPLTHANHLSITNNDTTINPAAGSNLNMRINAAMTMASDRNLTITAFGGPSAIPISGAGTSLVTSGSGALSITAASAIVVYIDASLTTVNGGISLSANLAGTATGVTSAGVYVLGLVETTGTGPISIVGRAPSNTQIGVDITGRVRSTSATNLPTQGTISIQGTGGSVVNSNRGVVIGLNGDGFVQSSAGNISITGQGGLIGNAASIQNEGVMLNHGSVSAANQGSITIQGTAGGNGIGVNLTVGGGTMQIQTEQGTIQILGVSGPDGPGGEAGVWMDPGASIASTTGAILIEGDGAAGVHGVLIRSFGFYGTPLIRSTGGGPITVQGTAGTGAGGLATILGVSEFRTLVSTSGSLTFIGDSFSFTGDGFTNTGTVNFIPLTPGTPISLGGVDILTGAKRLGLADFDLDNVIATTMNVGNATTGNITVDAAVVPAQNRARHVTLTTVGNIIFNSELATAGFFSSGGPVVGNLVLNPAATGNVQPKSSTTDVTTQANAGTTFTTSFAAGSDLAIAINGTTPHTQYDRLTAIGMIDLTGVDLVISGAYVPEPGNSFVIVENNGADPVIGTFNGLAEGATVVVSGIALRLSYVGGDGNDVTLVAPFIVDTVADTVAADGFTSLREAITASNSSVGVRDSIRFSIPRPFTNGLVSWWRGEGNANDIVDGNDGTLENGATANGVGQYGRAFSLDGVDDEIALPATATGNLDITGDQLTIDAWVNPTTYRIGGTGQVVLDKWFDTVPNGYDLDLQDGRLRFQTATTDSGGAFTLTAPAPVAMNAWTHVAVTYDGANVRLYVNGVEQASAPLTGNILHNSFDASIGNDNNPALTDSGFTGGLDEVGVFNRALSAAEVLAIASGQRTIQPTSGLPTITDAVTIDGFTQPGSQANTNLISAGSNAVYTVEVSFTNIVGTGLTLDAGSGGSTIQGLVINHLTSGSAILITNGSNGNTIRGNYIGADVTGSAAAGGGGITVFTNNNTIGGLNPADRNLVESGITLQDNSGNIVQGNLVGTNASGTAVISGATAIFAQRTSNTTIGGPSLAARNVVGTNNGGGIGLKADFGSTASHDNLIQNNYVGLTADGTAVLSGLAMATGIGASETYNSSILGNVVVGNTVGASVQGIGIGGSQQTYNNTVRGNLIGTDSTGLLDLGNINTGINIIDANGNFIGGAAAGQGNLVNGGVAGINIDASGNTLQGNFIGIGLDGVAALGNAFDGLSIVGNNNVVGGAGAGEGNRIANNRNGVVVSSGTGNSVLGNSIFSNAGLGIDLGFNGVTPNDAGDADTGANNQQNFPVLVSTAASVNSTTIAASLDSTSGGTFRIEFFANANEDPSHFGEGETFLGAVIVTDNGSGDTDPTAGIMAFSFTTPTDLRGKHISMTATNTATNDTSEFSGACEALDVPGTNFIVTNTADSGLGSLRQAITNANANPGTDYISFCIPGSGVQTISPTSALPAITDPVTIDGYTQDGASANTLAVGNDAVLLIELNGNNTQSNALTISSGGSTVRGLIINRFTGNAVTLQTAGGNTMAGNWMGVSAAGTALQQNGRDIFMSASLNNLIGGTTPADRNVLAGSGSNGAITVFTGATATIQGNYVGMNAQGSDGIGAAGGIGLATSGNVLGGTAPGAGNVISGSNGVSIGAGIAVASNNIVQGNTIGLNAAGTATLANNSIGVRINSTSTTSDNNLIGGTTAAARNVIATAGPGILVNGATGVTVGNQIQGNYIGTNVAGTAAAGPFGGGSGASVGVRITGGKNNLIVGNVIANYGVGLRIESLANGNNTVQGNLIGTNAAGTAAIPNGLGIDIGVSAAASGNVIGGNTAAARNIVSGNSGDGILITSLGSLNTIRGNYIGVAADGVTSLPNLGDGIEIAGSNNTIGGAAAGEGNTIAFNSGDGVFVSNASAAGNAISSNSIYSNTGLGIDLNPNGVTPNDAGDGDSGANGLQNFPVITQATATATELTVQGTLDSTVGGTFRIEFFASPAADPSGFGEGQTFLGFVNATDSDSDGIATFTFLASGDFRGQFISSTATNTVTNDTSEFSGGMPAASDTNLTLDLGDSPDPVVAGNNLTYTITLTNNGGDAQNVSLSDVLPAGVTFVSWTVPGGWTKVDPVSGNGFTASASIATLPAAAVAVFTLVVNVDANFLSGGTLTNQATVATSTTDSNPADNTDSESTDVCNFIVTNTLDSGPGSLREVIDCANAVPGMQTITFAIPGAGVQTISPLTSLPTITDSVTIDGYSQPGSSPNTAGPGQTNNAVLLVELNGASAGGEGLSINAVGAAVQGLVINRFNVGIDVQTGADGALISGNFIGTNSTGMGSLGNASHGILLQADNGAVGGISPGQRDSWQCDSLQCWLGHRSWL